MGNGEMCERIECEAAALCLLLYLQRKHDMSPCCASRVRGLLWTLVDGEMVVRWPRATRAQRRSDRRMDGWVDGYRWSQECNRKRRRATGRENESFRIVRRCGLAGASSGLRRNGCRSASCLRTHNTAGRCSSSSPAASARQSHPTGSRRARCTWCCPAGYRRQECSS